MPGMDLLLNHQEVDQRLVNDGVGPVALEAEESAEGVLHGAGHGGEDVGLEGRQVDDVLADQRLRYLEPFREDLVEDKQLALGLEVDPGNAGIGEVEALEAVLVQDHFVLVLDLAIVGVDDDGAVLGGQELLVAVLAERTDYALELPGGCGTGRVIALPGDVDLENGLDVTRQGVGVAGETHGVGDVVEHSGGAGVDDGDARPGRGWGDAIVHAGDSLRWSTARTSFAMFSAVRPYLVISSCQGADSA